MNTETLIQAFWAFGCVSAFLALLLVPSLIIEWYERRDLRRLRELEAARVSWRAKVIASQCFYKQES